MANDTIYYGIDGCLTDVATDVISGSFALGAGPAIATAQEQNCTIAYTNTGIYTITLYKTFTALSAALVTFQGTSAADKVPQIGAVDVVTAKTIVINLVKMTDTSAVDLATDGSERVNFYFKLVK